MSLSREQKEVLIVSVDRQFKELMKSVTLQHGGFRITEALSQKEAFQFFEQEAIDILFLDIERMPKADIDFLHFVRVQSPQTEIIIFTSIADLEEAANGLKYGASFYLVKPVSASQITPLLEKISSRLDLQREHIELEQQVLSDLMSGSPAMQKVLKLAMKIAPTSSTVLVSGESGTGKEFFARIIHRMSHRRQHPFVAMNCGSIPDTLFESELFGHKRGSFTGAERDKPGLVEEANPGTLLLDEVGELSPPAQVKLLRFLQERSFRRIGETVQQTVDVRILAATNKDLAGLVQAGNFREDLYYRLNVFNLHIPPLRERRETLPNLIRLFIHRNNKLLGRNVNTISKAAEVVFANYNYPGNVRELENIIEHAVVLAEGKEIRPEHLPEIMFRNRLLLAGPHQPTPASDIAPLKDVEREHITQALSLMNYNYSETAKKLGVSRSTLWRKIREYNIETK